jgi:L-iditol 2-dehydrogenase
MKALVLTEYCRMELAQVARPEPGPRDLLVRVRACGICGSDVHGYDGSTGRRIPPIIMGHEAAGVVEQVGAAVEGFRPGDRVTFDSMVSCGDCAYCRRGDANLCDRRQVLGVSCAEFRRDGAFAEYIVVPERIALPIPESMTFEQAAMLEPVSVAVHAVNLTPLTLGDTAVVVGAGMIGLLVIQALRVKGCSRIIAVDLEDSKLALARTLGADQALNPQSVDVPNVVRQLTGGRGADVALEAVGATDPIRTAILSVRKGGTVTLIGNVAPKVELLLQPVVTRQIRLQGSCASNQEYPACIDLVARGAIRVDELISARVPLEETAAWFDRLHAGDPATMKVIVNPA